MSLIGNSSSDRAWIRRARVLVFAVLCTVPSAAQLKTTNLGSGNIGGVVLLLTDSGFRPSAITLPDKPHVLLIQNRTGLRKMHVSLTQSNPLATRPNGPAPAELRGTDHGNTSQDQTIMLHVQPGVYYLTVKEKPVLQVKIEVK